MFSELEYLAFYVQPAFLCENKKSFKDKDIKEDSGVTNLLELLFSPPKKRGTGKKSKNGIFSLQSQDTGAFYCEKTPQRRILQCAVQF